MFKNLVSPLKQGGLQLLTVRHANKRVPKVDKKLQACAESLSARGFLRPNKPYDPPADIDEKVLKICSEVGLKQDSPIDELEKKFVVLNACFKETGHSVPNSLLHTIETVGDIVEFYNTAVDTSTPFDSLKKMDLPKNLYVQQDYVRFHPETDTVFNGVSAFPKSSTIVSGLKYTKKYQGYEVKKKWF